MESADAVVYGKQILRIQTESGEEEVYYPLMYDSLPAEYKVVAEKVLKETPAKKEEGLRTLKKFMKKENLSAKDDILITVLRSCKYNYKKSESKLKNYLKIRQQLIQDLIQMDENTIEAVLDVAPFSVLPYRDKLGRAIYVTHPPVPLDMFPLEVMEPVGTALFLYLLEFPLSTVCGMSYIGECKGISLSVLIKVLRVFRKYISNMLNVPMRHGRADICNEMPLVRIFYNAVRPMIPLKISDRVHFHGSCYKILHNAYHPDVLPSELDGNLGPRSDKFYREGLLNYIRNLKEEGRLLQKDN